MLHFWIMYKLLALNICPFNFHLSESKSQHDNYCVVIPIARELRCALQELHRTLQELRSVCDIEKTVSTVA